MISEAIESTMRRLRCFEWGKTENWNLGNRDNWVEVRSDGSTIFATPVRGRISRLRVEKRVL